MTVKTLNRNLYMYNTNTHVSLHLISENLKINGADFLSTKIRDKISRFSSTIHNILCLLVVAVLLLFYLSFTYSDC